MTKEKIHMKYVNFSEADAAAKTSTGWYWWLRSPGDYHGLAAYVNFDGSVSNDGYIVSNSSVAVRPAMWISIK